eukprot:NODE_802_length_1895_cov_40.555255_g740_i0.p1 GENE.NODE_802_length_1895_cov_40.555255_g740_i0~~NODE_802_length_1895_cov_40.555255_g740_i0.p1  ORF type:complete len:456 (-),score=67.21 NODE_802_length_1895_cov_40.555255_g740_i0:421-1788(-)
MHRSRCLLKLNPGLWHPEMRALSNSLYPRPFVRLPPPFTASHFAALSSGPDRATHMQQLGDLCKYYSHPLPHPDAREFRADFGPLILLWQHHREFCTFTFIRPQSRPVTPGSEPIVNEPFEESALKLVPSLWLGSLTSRLVTGIHVEVRENDPIPDTGEDEGLRRDLMSKVFGGHYIVGSEAGGRSRLYTDLRHDEDGFLRVLLVNGGRKGGMNGFKTGQTLQYILDVETYRMMAMLTIPQAKNVDHQLERVRRDVTEVMRTIDIEKGVQSDAARSMLDRLCHLSTLTETMRVDTAFRFKAAEQYHVLVLERLNSLNLTSVNGLQSIDTFLRRRFDPQMRACRSVEDALNAQTEQNARSVGLLQAFVSVDMEEQSHQSLRTMNATAERQLKLQNAVEGLSVIALSYYLCGLIGMVCNAAAAAGVMPVPPAVAVGCAVPVCIASLRLAVLRLRKRH